MDQYSYIEGFVNGCIRCSGDVLLMVNRENRTIILDAYRKAAQESWNLIKNAEEG